MAYRVGCEMSDEVAAIGVVAGSLTQRGCSPNRPIPLIAFHGTSDDEVPFTDSTYSPRTRSRLETPTVVPPAVGFWAANNGCRWSEATHPSRTIHEVRFSGCRGEVAFFAIEGGGHAWPGGAQDGDDGDPPTRALDASVELVRFFMQHPLQPPTAALTPRRVQ
jgi:polyhydroxybutyrate depolymerase